MAFFFFLVREKINALHNHLSSVFPPLYSPCVLLGSQLCDGLVSTQREIYYFNVLII